MPNEMPHPAPRCALIPTPLGGSAEPAVAVPPEQTDWCTCRTSGMHQLLPNAIGVTYCVACWEERP